MPLIIDFQVDTAVPVRNKFVQQPVKIETVYVEASLVVKVVTTSASTCTVTLDDGTVLRSTQSASTLASKLTSYVAQVTLQTVTPIGKNVNRTTNTVAYLSGERVRKIAAINANTSSVTLTTGETFRCVGSATTLQAAFNAIPGPGAPTDAEYVVLSANGSLSDERVLTAGTGISIVDGGAGSTVTISSSGGGGGSNVIWKWDGTLNDFTSAGTPEVTSGAGHTLSVQTSFRGNPALRMTAGASGFAQWVVDPSALAITLPRRYRMIFSIEEVDDGGGGKSPASRMGPTLFGQYNGAGDVLGYSACGYGNADAFLQVFTQNTTFGNAGATPNWRRPGTSARRGVNFVIDVEMTIGPTFALCTKPMCVRESIVDSVWEVPDTFTPAGNLNFDGTRFNNETPNTIGLAGNFTAAGHYMDVVDFVLLRHPADMV